MYFPVLGCQLRLPFAPSSNPQLLLPRSLFLLRPLCNERERERVHSRDYYVSDCTWRTTDSLGHRQMMHLSLFTSCVSWDGVRAWCIYVLRPSNVSLFPKRGRTHSFSLLLLFLPPGVESACVRACTVMLGPGVSAPLRQNRQA